jgi:hypothetical protein
VLVFNLPTITPPCPTLCHCASTNPTEPNGLVKALAAIGQRTWLKDEWIGEEIN